MVFLGPPGFRSPRLGGDAEPPHRQWAPEREETEDRQEDSPAAVDEEELHTAEKQSDGGGRDDQEAGEGQRDPVPFFLLAPDPEEGGKLKIGEEKQNETQEGPHHAKVVARGGAEVKDPREAFPSGDGPQPQENVHEAGDGEQHEK
jgi:hypothetical protein